MLPLIFVFTALTVLVFAFGARRLLGLRFSFLRTLIAGVLAFLDRLASNHGHQRLGGRKANERPARAVVRDPGRGVSKNSATRGQKGLAERSASEDPGQPVARRAGRVVMAGLMALNRSSALCWRGACS